MASGGSFMDMMRDDVGTDDISLSMPYEQEGYAEQDGFDIPTPTAKKARHARSSNYTQEDVRNSIIAKPDVWSPKYAIQLIIWQCLFVLFSLEKF